MSRSRYYPGRRKCDYLDCEMYQAYKRRKEDLRSGVGRTRIPRAKRKLLSLDHILHEWMLRRNLPVGAPEPPEPPGAAEASVAWRSIEVSTTPAKSKCRF